MRVQKSANLRTSGEGLLLLLGGAFFVGVLAGSLLCARMPGVGQLFAAGGQASGGLWQRFWPDGALLGMIFLAAWLRGGCLLTLLAVGVKGFLAAAQATGWVLALERAGYGAAVSQVLLPGLLSLAAMLLLGRQAMGWSVQRQRLPGGKGRMRGPDSTFFLTAAICLVLTVLSAAAACWLSPRLWQTVQTFLPMQ